MDPSSRSGTISIAFVREALAAARAGHADVAAICAATGITDTQLADDRARVSAATFGALWLAVARALDDEFFGQDSRRMKVGSFAALCRLSLDTPKLSQALRRIAQFFGILLDDIGIELQLSGPEASLSLRNTSAVAGRDPVFAHETLLVLSHGLACWLIGRRIPILRASFAYPAPVWHREYQDVFSQALEFDAPTTSITFSALLLEAPVIQNARSLQEFLRGAPANFILKFRDENSLGRRIRRHLMALPPTQWPGFDELADAFHIGATTMRRRLEREGVSFSQIKDSLRRDLAVQHLTGSDASLADIASELGFAEASAFHRAFKQWTGLRPGAYRG